VLNQRGLHLRRDGPPDGPPACSQGDVGGGCGRGLTLFRRFLSERGSSASKGMSSVVDELTPVRVARLRTLKRRLFWRKRLAAFGPALLPMTLLVGVVGARNLPARASIAGSGSGWAVRVCPGGDCTRLTSTLSPRQFASSRVVLSGKPQPTTRKTQVTLSVQSAASGATAPHTGIRSMIIRAHRTVNVPLATLPSLFAETGTAPRGATAYTITVLEQGVVLGRATVALTG